MKQFDLIVFDWDGTLMDSAGRIVACMQAAARDIGIPVPSDQAARDVIGLGLGEAIQRLFPTANDVGIAQLIDRYRHHFLGDLLAPSQLFRGAREVVETLAANDWLLGVATGKSRRGLDKVLAETGLAAHFHATRCADEAFSKPHPQMLEHIMDVLGVEPSRTLVVGDTEYDVQMAKSAGAQALGVSYGVHEPERLLACGASGCLDDIAELLAWLDATPHGGAGAAQSKFESSRIR